MIAFQISTQSDNNIIHISSLHVGNCSTCVVTRCDMTGRNNEIAATKPIQGNLSVAFFLTCICLHVYATFSNGNYAFSVHQRRSTRLSGKIKITNQSDGVLTSPLLVVQERYSRLFVFCHVIIGFGLCWRSEIATKPPTWKRFLRARLFIVHVVMTFTEEGGTALDRYSNSYFGFRSVTSRVSITFARERRGPARRRQRPSGGAHATAAIKADGPAPLTRLRGPRHSSRVKARETRQDLAHEWCTRRTLMENVWRLATDDAQRHVFVRLYCFLTRHVIVHSWLTITKHYPSVSILANVLYGLRRCTHLRVTWCDWTNTYDGRNVPKNCRDVPSENTWWRSSVCNVRIVATARY